MSGEGPSDMAAANALASTVLGYLLAGPLLYGAVGWALSRWLHITWALPVGLVAGMGLSLWTVWLRYGTPQAPEADAPASLPAALPQNEEKP